MIYCNLRGFVCPNPEKSNWGAQMTIDQLFSQGVSYDDVDTALKNPINEIPYCDNVNLGKNHTLAQDKWAVTGGLGASITFLTSCAAVLLYDKTGHLVVAGHAGFGTIKDGSIPKEVDPKINPETVRFAIFATPQFLPQDFDSYRDAIIYLANRCGGMQTVCFLDGFEGGGSVFANAEGGIIFPTSL